MGDALKVTQAKELRGSIINKLYASYGERAALSTVKNLLRYKGIYSEGDIKKAVCYLSGENKGYIKVEEDEGEYEYMDSLVCLTPAGVNLAEGDIEDPGVLINE